jgi:hypothetical protein
MTTHRRYFVLLAALSFTISAFSSFAQEKQAMLLGVYHFASNNDMMKSKKDDVMSEKRQKEIKDLVNKLKAFNPDKIFVEWKQKQRGRYMDSTYALYLEGKFELQANEVYQIGYRLGKMLGHKKLYCMDAEGNFLYDSLVSAAKKGGQTAMFEADMAGMRKEFMEFDSLKFNRTISENFIIMNSVSKRDLWRGNFVSIAPYLGVPGEYAGAEFLSEWYKRNIKMYSNIIRIVEPRDKKILIVVGAGHKPIINQMFEMNVDWKLVSPVDYLKK